MNSLKRVNAVLDLKRPDYVPVGFHNFLQAAAATGVGDLGAWLHNGEAMAEAHRMLWKKIGHERYPARKRHVHHGRRAGVRCGVRTSNCLRMWLRRFSGITKQLAAMEPPDPFTVEPLKAQVPRR